MRMGHIQPLHSQPGNRLLVCSVEAMIVALCLPPSNPAAKQR